jgi:flagellar assembly protein FliH
VALAAKLASLEQIMLHLFDPIAEQDTQIEKGLVQLVAHITRQVIGRELRSDSSQSPVLREALKLLPMGADNIRIHLNPQDFELARPCASAMKKLAHRSKTRRCCRVAAASSGAQPHRCDHGNAYQKAVAQLFDQSHDQFLHPAAPDMRSNWMCRRDDDAP